MFKNTFQSGFLSILYSIGSKPLQIWDKQVGKTAYAHLAPSVPCGVRGRGARSRACAWSGARRCILCMRRATARGCKLVVAERVCCQDKEGVLHSGRAQSSLTTHGAARRASG